jgi:DinB superfamily
MIAASLTRLEFLCRIIPAKLAEFKEEEWTARPSPEKWSKKEILGHLIDSATNNHHRFVRAQFEDRPLITYNADDWVAASHYQNLPVRHMLYFWQLYNLHIALIIHQLPEAVMERECNSGDEEPHTLAWLFDDYVVHLEHHLREMVEYE